MEKNLITKIKCIVAKNDNVDEGNICYLMILVRKMLEKMSQSDQDLFLTLKLFCNWAAHIEITQSNTGLKILAKINDTLVNIKNYKNITKIRTEMSNAIGFSVFRKELKLFFNNIGVTDTLVSNNNIWAVVLMHLIEIIRDSSLSFPALSKLDKTKQKIYNQIAKKPIKIGAGVISAKISLIKYPPPTNKVFKCLTIRTEDTTTIVIPLLIDVRL